MLQCCGTNALQQAPKQRHQSGSDRQGPRGSSGHASRLAFAIGRSHAEDWAVRSGGSAPPNPWAGWMAMHGRDASQGAAGGADHATRCRPLARHPHTRRDTTYSRPGATGPRPASQAGADVAGWGCRAVGRAATRRVRCARRRGPRRRGNARRHRARGRGGRGISPYQDQQQHSRAISDPLSYAYPVRCDNP